MMRAKLIYALLLSAMMIAVTATVSIRAHAADAESGGATEEHTVDASETPSEDALAENEQAEIDTAGEETGAEEDAASVDELPGPVTLNPIIEVDGDFIRLGDIFSNAGDNTDRAVVRAPKPGVEATLGAVWLWKLARAYGLDWRPASKLDIAVASRRSTTIGTDRIVGVLRDALFVEIGEDDLVELFLDDATAAVHLPTTAEPSLRLERFRFDASSNRFSAVLIAPATGRALEKRTIGGRIQRMAEVAVPVRRLSKGTVIRDRDLEVVRYRADKLGQNVVSDASLVVGMAVKRTLSAGKPIRSGDVHPPILVRKGQRVTVVFEAANMLLTTQGRAMEDGAKDELIRIQNLKSLVVIDGVVVGSNKVAVRPVGNVALN